MERKRRKGSRLTDGKKNVIAVLIDEYDIPLLKIYKML